MLNLIALALFITTLAFSWTGIIQTKGNTALRRFWILLGFGELLLAFISFLAIPSLLYIAEDWTTIVMIVFCLVSMGAILVACLYPTKE